MAEKNRKQVINLHSADDKMPVSQLSLGEIGVVHTNTTDAKLYVETNENAPTSGTLATFITENAINNKISSVYSVIGDVVDNLISVAEGDEAVTVTLTGKDDQNSGTTLSVKHKTVSGLSDGFDKVSVDGFGHVTGTTAVTINDITGLSGFNDAVTTAMQTKVDELSGATIAVENKVDELSGAVETTFVASVEYNRAYDTGSAIQPTIIFYDKKGQVIDTVDATEFIKDGMIDGVAIGDVGGVKSLIIDFNTDSGKQDVSIPLTDFFDPSLYYTKTEINTLSGEIETKIESLSSATETIESNLNTLSGSVEDLSASTVAIENDLKALSGAVETNYYTKTEIDGKELVINGKITDLSASTKSINDTLVAHTSDIDIHVTATEKSTWNGKQDAISDLETIRNNALSGASAYTDMLTGVTMNGSPATVTNKVAAISADTNVIETVKVNGTALTVTDKAVDITVPSVEPYFDGAEYDSTDKKIYFKHGATIITSATIDATDFIKDGMVDSVTVDTASGGTHSGETCLIITFNEGVEGQKEDIYIPLTSIFDPSNYYTTGQTYSKTEVDAISGQLNTKIETLSGSVVDLSASTVVVKNDLVALSGVVETDYYDKDDIDGLLGDFVPVSAYVKDEKVIAAAFNEINTRVNELSGNSSTSTDAITALQSSVNNNTADIVDLTDDLSNLSASTMAMETAVGNAITAITMNGTAQTKTNNAVDLGTVLTPSDIITSEAALSGVSTTGSVVDATVVNNILANLIERTEYEDDLYVVAKAFNDLNDRLNAIESRLSSLENDVNVFQGGNY